jgi:hypothetical protein
MLEMPSKLSGTSFPHCRISFRGAESVASLSSVWSAGLTTDATGCSISLRGAASIPSFKIPSSVWSARLITGAMLRCIFLRDSASMPAVAFSRLFCRPCFPRTAVVSFVAAACSANEDPNPVDVGGRLALAALASINMALGAAGLAAAAAPNMPPGFLAPPNMPPAPPNAAVIFFIAESAFLTFFHRFFAGVHLARPCDARGWGW